MLCKALMNSASASHFEPFPEAARALQSAFSRGFFYPRPHVQTENYQQQVKERSLGSSECVEGGGCVGFLEFVNGGKKKGNVKKNL
jgi:hypothetical protein